LLRFSGSACCVVAAADTAPVPASVVQQLRDARADSILGREWGQLAVGVLSARDYKAFGSFVRLF
jgi:hypothetical protein